jgi:UDP-N-acetylmuramoyl-tripeptide--D-alanyl-D-alanine ligase
MNYLTLDEMLKATGGETLCVDRREFTGLSIDSRTIKEGELFVALKGDNFDGHDFLKEALKAGAGAVVHIPTPEKPQDKTLIYVKNTLAALQDIARHMRLRMNVPVIGVTGTNGKTTTKELLASILGKSHRVLKTQGNMNNHIGLPLSIANMRGDETAMVLEMGSNAEGDINFLCEIAKPGVAVITNVGPAHLEGFGSLEMVRKTDLEILAYVKSASANADDFFLMEGLKEFRGDLVTYGIENSTGIHAKDIRLEEKAARFTLCFTGGGQISVRLGIAGKFNIYNALAAASVAYEMGVDLDQIKNGLESFTGVPMRMEIKELFGALVISDVYNANPASMREALTELMRQKKQRTIAVLGDMQELGQYSEDAHRELVRLMSDLNIDIFIAVGKEMERASPEFRGICYKADDSTGARSVLLSICRDGDTVLVKGSRSMHMERVLAEPGKTAIKGGSHAL